MLLVASLGFKTTPSTLFSLANIHKWFNVADLNWLFYHTFKSHYNNSMRILNFKIIEKIRGWFYTQKHALRPYSWRVLKRVSKAFRFTWNKRSRTTNYSWEYDMLLTIINLIIKFCWLLEIQIWSINFILRDAWPIKDNQRWYSSTSRTNRS